MTRPGRSEWWRSAGVRFGFAYAILFGFSTIAVVAFVWWSTAGDLARQTEADINKDLLDLNDAYNNGGLPALLDEVQRRVLTNIEDDAAYMLVDRQLRRTAGNLSTWPVNITDTTEEARVDLSLWGTEPPMPFQLRHIVLPGQFHLLVGRNIHTQALLGRKLVDAIPYTVAIMLMLGVFGAVTVRRLFVSMLADVSATAVAITAGDLSSRVPISGRGDEFDALAETVNDMLDRISRLMDGVRGVSNAIAHDLRTPITRARARLEDAARDGVTEAELRTAVERAIADLDAVVDVFQALLRIAEIEAGARRSAFAAFDLVPLLGDLVELYEAAAEERGQRLVLDVPASLTMFGDRDMVQQAVANLLDNSLKFSPPATAVTIAAARPSQQAVAVTVSDQGPGIPEQDRARAPERFFRGESARHAPGSGLGLALVQAVAVLHGGTLRLDDNRPGLRATLSLPAVAPPPAPEGEAEAMDGGTPGSNDLAMPHSA